MRQKAVLGPVIAGLAERLENKDMLHTIPPKRWVRDCDCNTNCSWGSLCDTKAPKCYVCRKVFKSNPDYEKFKEALTNAALSSESG